MLISGKEYKERETELTADEYLRCGIADEKYSKTLLKYMDVDTGEKELLKLWEQYKSLWLQRLAFFLVGDVSGLALEKISDTERQAVDDFFTGRFLPYLKRSIASQKTLSDTEKAAQVS